MLIHSLAESQSIIVTMQVKSQGYNAGEIMISYMNIFKWNYVKWELYLFR